VEEMQGKAEDTLSALRKKEMSDSQSFEMLKSGLEAEIKHGNEKLSTATSGKAAAAEALATADKKKVETAKSKAADEEYAGTLKTECETKASEWEERQKSATAEMGAIDKAKDILLSGVKAFVQTKSSLTTHRWSPNDDDESDSTAATREKVVHVLKSVAAKTKSFAFAQLASMAQSDPFVKIRGLIEDMIAKLLKEAEDEATQKAFCDEEMGKSKKSQDERL
jgi:adenosyl cobinamide kinase/adenosyl cobinamide phosphate guanylyltransferase